MIPLSNTKRTRLTHIWSGLALTLLVFGSSSLLAQEPPEPTMPSVAPAATENAAAPVQNVRLRSLQNRVVSLKQEVFKTKTRLMLIKERLLNNVIAEAKLTVHHSNELSGAFSIQEIIYYLDDNKIYYGDSRAGNLADKKKFEIFDGNVVPGHHVLGVETVLVGNSALFPYVGEFKFRVRSNYTFFAPRGRITVLSPTLHEKGGLLRDYRDRPSVKYGIKQFPYTRENMEKVTSEPKKAD